MIIQVFYQSWKRFILFSSVVNTKDKALSWLSNNQYHIYRLSHTQYLTYYVATHINLRNISIYRHNTFCTTLLAHLCTRVYACINSLSRFPLCKVVSGHCNCCKCYRGNRQSFFHFAMQSKLIWNDAPETKLRCGTRQIWVKATQSEHKLTRALTTYRYPVDRSERGLPLGWFPTCARSPRLQFQLRRCTVEGSWVGREAEVGAGSEAGAAARAAGTCTCCWAALDTLGWFIVHKIYV